MDTYFQALPPLKRFRVMQEHERNLQLELDDDHTLDPLSLPGKKRKESRDSALSASDDFTFPHRTAAPAPFCLPTKKRVWALQLQPESLDLNVEYKPALEEEPVSTFVQKEDNKKHSQDVDEDEDDGILCAICQSTDGDPSDPIVFCDGCDLMVHSSCYGNPLAKCIPDGDWFCIQCLATEKTDKTAVSCCLCPMKGGAMKPTNDGRWAHIVCSLFVPEVFFQDPDGREGIVCSKIPTRRWKSKCYICQSFSGCAIDCSELKCTLSFHVTCGLKEDLCIEYKEGRKLGAIVAGFCKNHTALWKKQQLTGKFKIVARDEGKL